MSGLNFDLLKRLCETPGVSSREEQIRKLVMNEMKPLVDTLEVDVLGSVIGFKKGASDGPRVMIAAHMDEIGFLVKHIDDKGFVRLQPVGGWDPRAMMAQRVFVHGFSGERLRGSMMPGAKPIHLLTTEELNKSLKTDDYFVDLGMPAEKIRSLIEVGDPVTMDRTAELVGDHVVSKTLDNRLSVFIMLEAMKVLKGKPIKSNVMAVATTQEEVGLRGASTSSYSLQPDIAIALDGTLANDFPGPPDYDQVTRLGHGVGIKIMDSSLLCHPKLVKHFREIADAKKIKYQLEILSRGGTDAGAMQRSRGGVASFTLSVPMRYVHTVNETAHLEDIQGAIDLLVAFLEEAHTRKYDYSE